MVSLFVMDKRICRICRFTKDTVIKSLMFFGVKPHSVTKGTVFFMCGVLMPTAEACLEMAMRVLITKDLVLRTDYEGRRWTRVAVSGEHLAASFMQYSQSLGATSDNLNGRWSFNNAQSVGLRLRLKLIGIYRPENACHRNWQITYLLEVCREWSVVISLLCV